MSTVPTTRPQPLLGPLESFRVEPPPTGSRRSILLKGAGGSGKTDFVLRDTPGPILNVYQDNDRMTLEKFLARRDDIHEVHFDTWAEFDDQFVPLVKNRLIDVPTIVIDTGDMLQGMMWREIKGNKSRLTTPDFGTGFDRLSDSFKILTGGCRPLAPNPKRSYVPGGHPGYHFICTWHLYDVTTDQGALVRTTPRVLGQFKDHLEELFDIVLLMDTALTGEVQEQPGGARVMVNKKTCFARTVPPNQYHSTKAPLDWPEKIHSYSELAALIEAESKKEEPK
jgi:hypothetical protein